MRRNGAGSVLCSILEVNGEDSVPKEAIFGLTVSSSGVPSTTEPVCASEFEAGHFVENWQLEKGRRAAKQAPD